MSALSSIRRITNAFSVDVEDYFHVLAFKTVAPRGDWDRFAPRVEQSVNVLLDELATAGVHATFFTLGWVAERFPGLVRRMAIEGHEVASHGYFHDPLSTLSPDELRRDAGDARKLLQDLSGQPVNGYRAPSYSINERNLWAFEILAEVGHKYSSSIYPGSHDIYGMRSSARFPYRVAHDAMLEIPVSTIEIAGSRLSCGGGGFFRLWPYPIFRAAIRHVNASEGMPTVFYIHPWEIDPRQPRMSAAPWKSRFRHYLNLAHTLPRLRKLLGDFSWDRVDRVYQVTD